jgi:hypothetical protein
MILEQSEITVLIGLVNCLFSGLAIKYSLMYSNQKWVENFHSTITFMALPVITFVITKVIYDNIALSLGMIGALSIVRFRNPVKNSLELVIYFALITVGIANSVHLKWAFLLVITIVFIIIFCNFFRNTILIGRNSLNLSFDEGELKNSIEISSNKRIQELDNSERLVFSYFEKENNSYVYNLNSSKKNDIKIIYDDYIHDDRILSLKVDYV